MADLPQALDRIDPADAWAPWHPSASEPWGRKWAAHLYRRAAFGPSRDDLVEAERLGSEKTLDLLLTGRPHANDLLPTLIDVGRVAAAHDDGGEQLRGWWIYVMLRGGDPLREKLTLFWHNHFATSIVKVQDSALIFQQNCLLRTHAMGKFGTMLHAISRDPAMLVWLDSNRNIAGQPNENYARELMELFSLGVGHYTETDIREAARAFTGWHTDGHAFTLQARLHDDGSKTVLHQSGRWNGDDVVRIVLAQPAAAQFLVRKLYRYFISENAEPPDQLLEPLASAFRKSDYDIAALVRTMLSSRLIYSNHAFRQRVKSPVEYVLGAVKAICRSGAMPGDEMALPQQALVGRINAMGQALFAPPNVKGWPGGRAWLNTATMLERDNFAAALASGSLWTNPVPRTTSAAGGAIGLFAANPSRADSSAMTPPAVFDSARIVDEEQAADAAAIVRALLELHVPGGVRPEVPERLIAYIAGGSPARPKRERIREAVHAILTMPEYQLA